MPLLSFPVELLLMIADGLNNPKDINSLLQANRRFAFLLTPVLHDFALQKDYRQEALFWAAARGHESTVRLLLERAFAMDLKGVNGKLLHQVPGKCDDAIIRLVLEEGADLIIKDNCGEMSALQWAAFHGRGALVALLLSKGADVDFRNNDAQTALCLAVQNKHKPVINMLIEKMDITFIDKHGRTLLHVAVEYCDETIARSLLDRGADATAMGYGQYPTPLIMAIQRGDEALALVELLLEYGANTKDQDDLQRTALHLAAANKGMKTVELLLERGADVNSKDTYRRTPLHIAVLYKSPAVSILLEKGVAIDAQDIFGRTALLLATQRTSNSIVRLLLSNGADVTIPDYCGRTVPHGILG